MSNLSKAASALGAKGGRARVDKGFSVSKETASEAGKKGMLNRWGKRVRIELDLIYPASNEPAMLAAATKLNHAHPPVDIQQAISRLSQRALSDLFETLNCSMTSSVVGTPEDIGFDVLQQRVKDFSISPEEFKELKKKAKAL